MGKRQNVVHLRLKWQSTPVFLPGKSHGKRSLAGYRPWGLKRFRHNLGTKQQQQLRAETSNQSGGLLSVIRLGTQGQKVFC